MVKLADTLDLGSNATSVQVQVLSSVPQKMAAYAVIFLRKTTFGGLSQVFAKNKLPNVRGGVTIEYI